MRPACAAVAATMVASSHGRGPFRSRLAPERRARVQPGRGGAEDAVERRERAATIRARRRTRRLLALGASCWPSPRSVEAPEVPSGPARGDDALEDVLVHAATDANAPVPADRSSARMTPAVRRLLGTRRGANALLSDAVSQRHLMGMPEFLLGPPRYPARPLCSVCNYWGDATCMACGEPYCGRSCGEGPADTRCERGVW